MGKRLVSLSASRSMVSLVQQSYFDQNIKPKLGPARELEANLQIYLTWKEQMEVTSL